MFKSRRELAMAVHERLRLCAPFTRFGATSRDLCVDTRRTTHSPLQEIRRTRCSRSIDQRTKFGSYVRQSKSSAKQSDQKFTRTGNTTSAPPTASIQQIFGVVGIIRLIAGEQLLKVKVYSRERRSSLIFRRRVCRNDYYRMSKIPFFTGRYLIVITKRQQVGQIDGHPIWKITETDVISFARSSRHLTEIQVHANVVVVVVIIFFYRRKTMPPI